MKRTKYICCILLLGLVLCAGCGARLPEMTEEQEDKIVEYAAKVVMRHINDYDSRLVDLSLYSSPEPETGSEEKEESEPNKMDETADTPTVDISEEENSMTLEQVLLPAGAVMVYSGYSIVDTYPDPEDGELYFALDASEGKRLLVLQFQVSNTTGSPLEMDNFSHAPRCTVILNDTDRVRTMSTMLLDDLSTYIGTLESGQEISLVLVAEIDGTVDHVERLDLSVQTDVGNASAVLQ